MTVNGPNPAAPASGAGFAADTPQGAGRNWSALGQADFIKLLTAQLRQQDPTDPVDNKEMLAQMAQFSSLAGINDVNSNLQQMLEKLDLLVAAQAASIPTSDAKE